MSKQLALTYLTTEATLLDLATDTGSNHTGIPDSAATVGKTSYVISIIEAFFFFDQ